jgi:hypothetical protein
MQQGSDTGDAMTTPSAYPRTETLRRGVLLRAIVNAVMVAKEPDLARFLSWDGRNYVLNNADGTYGAITFEAGDVVGVFFDSQSDRNPHTSVGSYDYDIDAYFRGMPSRLRSIAESQTLRYNRQVYLGQTVPLITAAFWSAGEYLTAAFPWSDVFRHGAHIVRVEFLPGSAALKVWQESYQASPEELDFARSLYDRRMSDPSRPVVLEESEVDGIWKRAQDSDAFADCLKALEPLRILPPRT